MFKAITVETTVNAPIEKVWQYWTSPEHIVKWSHASDDWECTYAENDIVVGGKFLSRLGAKDKSAGFDFGGVYTEVEENKLIAYTMGDGRSVKITFQETPDGVRIVETFDMENQNTEELQRNGWQAFIDNYKTYVENN